MAEVEKICRGRGELRCPDPAEPPVREREVHGLRQVRGGVHHGNRESIQLRHEQDQGGLSSSRAGIPTRVTSLPRRSSQSPEAGKVKDACPYDAIDLDMSAKTFDLKVGSIVWATGWKPYDAGKLDTYGFGQYPDVITNVMMERLAAFSGPTGGKIVRPSDGQPPKTVAFIQCAGSRDENHLPFCSGICCLASMKQATYVREQYPDAKSPSSSSTSAPRTGWRISTSR